MSLFFGTYPFKSLGEFCFSAFFDFKGDTHFGLGAARRRDHRPEVCNVILAQHNRADDFATDREATSTLARHGPERRPIARLQARAAPGRTSSLHYRTNGRPHWNACVCEHRRLQPWLCFCRCSMQTYKSTAAQRGSAVVTAIAISVANGNRTTNFTSRCVFLIV